MVGNSAQERRSNTTRQQRYVRPDRPAEPLPTTGEVAWVIGPADLRTVHKMIRRGEPAATKVGNHQYRIDKAAVLQLLNPDT